MSDTDVFGIDNGVLRYYNGRSEYVEVPQDVTEIGEGAFMNNCYVLRVRLPDGVRRIGRRAFYGCRYLTEINLPRGIGRLAPSAFAFCESLERINFPEGLLNIGRCAFFDCKHLEKVVLPEGLLSIEGCAFYKCGIPRITLPQSLRSVGSEAFAECSFLRTVEFPQPDNVALGDAVFRECRLLTDENGLLIVHDRLFFCVWSERNGRCAVLPDGVKRIEPGAVSGSIQSIEMPLACPEWGADERVWKGGTDYGILRNHGQQILFRGEDGAVAAKVVLACAGESRQKTRKACKAIRQNADGFDFEAYDRLFYGLKHKTNRLLTALARVEYPYALSPETEKDYLSFLRRNIADAAQILLQEDNTDFLMQLCDRTRPTATGFQAMISLVQSAGDPVLTAWLIDRKNVFCGSRSAQRPREPSLELLPDDPCCLTAREGGRRYRTGTDAVCCTVTEYIGDETDVVLPEKIGRYYVNGLGQYAFSNRCPVKPRRISVPGWYTRFDGPCFSFLSDLTVEFREGIVSLPPELFLVANRVTVRLPRSLRSLGDQRLDDPKYGSAHNRYLVPAGSDAERICRENGWRFETYDAPPDALDARGPEVLAEIAALREKIAAHPWKAPKPGSAAAGRYLGRETHIVFPSRIGGVRMTGVADTGGRTPENYGRLTSVVIPEGYTFIGRRAFAGCRLLETVSLPASLKEIRTNAFAGCRSLKTLYLRSGVCFKGTGFFSGAVIDTVILETSPCEALSPHVFFGCRIRRLVVLGGSLRCGGRLFTDPRVPGGGYGFPETIYMNGRFGAKDLFGRGGIYLDLLRPLAAFDESTLEDAALRARVAEEKAMPGALFDYRTVLVHSDPPPEKLVFQNAEFVLYDRYAENYPGETRALYDGIQRRGGDISLRVTWRTAYLILPDCPVLEDSAVRAALRMRRAGKDILFLRRSDLRRYLNIKTDLIFM